MQAFTRFDLLKSKHLPFKKSHKTSAFKKIIKEQFQPWTRKTWKSMVIRLNNHGQAWNLNVLKSKSSKWVGRRTTYLVTKVYYICDIKKV